MMGVWPKTCFSSLVEMNHDWTHRDFYKLCEEGVESMILLAAMVVVSEYHSLITYAGCQVVWREMRS